MISYLASQHFSESDANFFLRVVLKNTQGKRSKTSWQENECDSLWFLGLLPRHDEDSTVANVLLASLRRQIGVFKQALAWEIN